MPSKSESGDWWAVGIVTGLILIMVIATAIGLWRGNPKPASRMTTATMATTTTTTAGGGVKTAKPTSPTTLPMSTKKTAVKCGSFQIVNGQVHLSYDVVKGDTLFAIAKWFKLMGGYAALYDWNHTTVGNNPNLIYPGEVLTITVPRSAIPKISPVWLAETKGAK